MTVWAVFILNLMDNENTPELLCLFETSVSANAYLEEIEAEDFDVYVQEWRVYK